jgi:hypothetical protein
LELALLSQNLGHGWAGLHQAVMAAEQWLVSAHPWTALALSDQQVDAELLKQFIVSSSELLSHEPSLGQMLVADQAWFLVTSILPSFFGPQWRPRLPGQGAPGDERPMPNRPPPGSQFTHPSQVLFFFLGMRVKSARVLEVCGGQASPVACLELLVRHTSVEREMASQQELWPRVKLGLEEFGAVGALFLALGLEGNPPRGPSLETMLYRFLARRGALAMLRLEAAVRLHALRFQGPPDEAAMRAEAWRPLLVDEVFGGVYTIQVKDDLVTVKPGSLPAGLTPEQASWFFHDFTLEGPRSPGDTPLPSLPGGPRP